jgi:thioredoxin reductase
MTVDVLIVGGGPAGLEAARRLRQLSNAHVRVLDREPELGGVPRHCFHTGFGWSDLHRLYSGPRYAARRRQLALAAGAELRADTTVLSFSEPTTLVTTSLTGISEVRAQAVLLATGCRERPRAARLVPGTRPQGVLTTGSLQQLVYLSGVRAGRRAVVVGAEHVSFSAVHTLVSTGTEVAAMVTELPAHQSYEPLRWATTWWHDVPILTRTTVTRIDGRRRVEAVELRDELTGARRTLACDTVVFTGDFIPDHELARAGDLELDAGTRGPAVDLDLRTSRPGVFAAGNLLHGAETADVSALDGRHAADAIARFLAGAPWEREAPPIVVEPPLRWIFPNRIAGRAPPRDHFVMRVARFCPAGELEVHQGTRLLHRQPLRRAVPNRALRLNASWVGGVRPDGGPVRVRVSL